MVVRATWTQRSKLSPRSWASRKTLRSRSSSSGGTGLRKARSANRAITRRPQSSRDSSPDPGVDEQDLPMRLGERRGAGEDGAVHDHRVDVQPAVPLVSLVAADVRGHLAGRATFAPSAWPGASETWTRSSPSATSSQ